MSLEVADRLVEHRLPPTIERCAEDAGIKRRVSRRERGNERIVFIVGQAVDQQCVD